MVRIYTRTGHHDIPDTLLKVFGQIVAQANIVTDVHLQPEIDETEATPVLEDVPEDPEVTIERLNARILELEAEVEEHKRHVDTVLEALRPLGTPAEVPVASETSQTVQGPVPPDYDKAQAGARVFLRDHARYFADEGKWV